METTERSALVSPEMRQITTKSRAKQLKRSLGCFDIFVYVVSAIIGAGIYVSPGLVAKYTNNMGTAIIVWAISGILCLFGALCFCELAIALRKTGSGYIFIKEAYGDLAGFCAIWAQTLIISPTGAAVISITSSEHIVGMFADVSSHAGQLLIKIIAVSFVLIAVAINCISISFSAKAQTVFAVIQVLSVVLDRIFPCIDCFNSKKSFRDTAIMNSSVNQLYRSVLASNLLLHPWRLLPIIKHTLFIDNWLFPSSLIISFCGLDISF